MRDLYIDGRRVDMAAFVANNGTMAGRPCPHIRGGWWRATWSDSKSDLIFASFAGKHCAIA